MFKCTLYLRQTDTRVVHERVLEQAGTAKHHGGGAKRAETWPVSEVIGAGHRQGGGVGRCSSGIV